MQDDGDTTGGTTPDSLMPYDTWTEQAMRHVAVQALKHAARLGLPGEHHFYLTFRTDDPATTVPARLKAQYPQEMTIVLQHQFWDLTVDEARDRPGHGVVTVGLTFGGVPSTLVIPIHAITAFADPHVRFGLRFRYDPPQAAAPARVPSMAPVADPAAPPADSDAAQLGDAGQLGDAAQPGDVAPAPAAPQVVSLDAFRRRTPPRDT